EFPNVFAGNLAVKVVAQLVNDVFDNIINLLLANRPFLTSLLYSGSELIPGKLLRASVSFSDHQARSLHLFICGEAMGALNALTAAADSGPLARGARINHLVVVTSALGTPHKRLFLPLNVAKIL
ncbi:MAG TPA: hypothetical protein VMZ27_11915, partial [Candidatus Saccharimonadales bacterium]|nr:hypothetical protein [Candidatus Saccharimonadales bacterium]